MNVVTCEGILEHDSKTFPTSTRVFLFVAWSITTLTEDAFFLSNVACVDTKAEAI